MCLLAYAGMHVQYSYRLREFGCDDARSDGVHAHVVCGELSGEHFRHLEQRRLRDAVSGEPGERLEAGDRRHEQDAAAAASRKGQASHVMSLRVQWRAERMPEAGLERTRPSLCAARRAE